MNKIIFEYRSKKYLINKPLIIVFKNRESLSLKENENKEIYIDNSDTF